MKKVKILILSLFLMCTLSGCLSEEDVLQTEGEVYNKEFIGAELVKEQRSTSNGKDYIVEVSYPDRYIIYLKYKDIYAKDELYVTYAFYVSEEMFEKTNIGDKYLYNKVKDSLNLSGVIERELESTD